MKTKTRHNPYAGTVVLVLFTLTFAFFFIGMPRYLDDLWYSVHLKPWFDGVPGASPLSGILETWTDHIATDNVRLANIVFVPFLLLPKWVGSGIAAVLWGLAMYRGALMAGINPRRLTVWLCLAMFMWAFFLPWYDCMGVENFQFNYIWATFLAVAALKVFFSDSDRNKALTFILGITVGTWHEGFTAPLIASFSAVLILFPSKRNARRWWLLAGLSCGMVWMLAWPASWNKVSEDAVENGFGLSRLLYLCFQHPAFLLMLLTVLTAVCRERWRKLLRDPFILALIISALVNFAIHFVTTRTSRPGWWGEFCSVLVIVGLLKRMCTECRSRHATPYIYIASALLLSLTFIRQALVDYYTVSVSRAYCRALNEHIHTGKNTVFAEVPEEHTSPLICMFAPDFTPLLAPVNLLFVNMYFHPDNDGTFNPVPQELRRVTSDTGTPVPPIDGGTDLHIREIDGRLFMPTEEEEGWSEFTAQVDFGYTVKDNVRMLYHTFTSEADGHRYAYLYPWRRVVEMRLGHPRAISPTGPL